MVGLSPFFFVPSWLAFAVLGNAAWAGLARGVVDGTAAADAAERIVVGHRGCAPPPAEASSRSSSRSKPRTVGARVGL